MSLQYPVHSHGVAAYLLATLMAAMLHVASAQPTISGPDTAEGYTGVPLDLHYTVQWQGTPADYAVFPASIETPEGVEARVAQGEAHAEGGTVTVEQTIRVQSDEPFVGEIPPVTVDWSATDALTADSKAIRNVLEGPAVTLRIRDYAKVRRTYIGVGVAAGLGLGALGFLVLARRKRRKTTGQAGLTPAERFRNALHEARQHRLDGDFYGYYRALSGAAKLTTNPGLTDRLGQRARAVGYQGVKPTDDELDGDFKDVERAFAGSREAANL